MSQSATTKKEIVAKTFLHSCYIENTGRGDDALVVSEIVEYSDGETKPRLQIYKNPKVPVWITQPSHRDHTEKKEFESVNCLDQFDVPYKHKDRELFKLLNDRAPNFISRAQRREIYQSPYVYGGNITIEAHVAMKYKDELRKKNLISHQPTTGFFDIEMSLIPETYGKFPLLSFTAENKVFLAMKRSFMYEHRDGKIVPVTVDDVRDAANKIILPLVDQLLLENEDLEDAKAKMPFEFEFFVGDTEIEMIMWIFDRMHETKTSFIGVWNLGFDIPQIIKKLQESQIPLEQVFSDPSLRNTEFAYAHFKEDTRDVAHYTQKWHWLSAAAHFQFIDSMALYSYTRVVDGKEASYALDAILRKFNLGGKLKIKGSADPDEYQEADWHREMLSKHFVAYALYAMWDTMSLQLLEWINNDLTAMMQLSDTTPVKFFPNQTIRVTNTLFQDYKPQKYILGTGVDIEETRDDDLLTAGGAVLEPQRIVGQGISLFIEAPKLKTRCYAHQADVDFSALYPTLTVVQNISKQTKIATMLSITAPWVNSRYKTDAAIEVYCSYLITPNANGVELGFEFFNLPDYREMKDLFREHVR